MDVDLELGEGDDEPHNAFFDMRGEGFVKSGQGQGLWKEEGKDKDKEREKDREGKDARRESSDRPAGRAAGGPRSSGDSRLR